jgi:nucleotide-binding universal stress UspA family protein
VLVIRNDRPLAEGRWMVCVDGSSYAYKALRIALQMAREYRAKLYVCSAFDVEYHHVVFGNIKDVLSVQASKVFKFEEQEELHNNIIDKGLLKLCQANLKRAQVMAQEYPDVEIETQILIGKPFQCILQWVEEIDPSMMIVARHGGHRVEGTDLGSQADNLVRLAPDERAAGRHAGRPPRRDPVDRGGRREGARVGARRRGPHPPRPAPSRSASPARRGRVHARQLRPGRERHRTRRTATAPRTGTGSVPPISADGLPMVTGRAPGRGDQEAPPHAHAADHGDRHRRGAGPGRGEGRRGDEAHRRRGRDADAVPAER